MATNKNRLAKLEKQSGAKIKYICVSYAKDTEYKAKPFSGGAGETFTFKSVEAMTKYFDKRKDLELLHIRVVYASEAQTSSE